MGETLSHSITETPAQSHRTGNRNNIDYTVFQTLRAKWTKAVNITMKVLVIPLPAIGNSLKKQRSLYRVIAPSIKPLIINSYGLMGAHDAYMRHWLVKG